MRSGLVTTVALLRRDAPWNGLAFALGASLAALVLLSVGFERLFVLGSGWVLDELYGLLLGPAMLVGVLRGLRDDLARTRELVEHRPVSRGRRAWTDALSGAALVGAWVPFAGGLVWLRELLFGLGGEAALPELWGPPVALALALVAHYALALLLVRLPVGWPWRLVLGLVLGLGLESIHSLLAGLRVDWLALAFVQLLASALLLVAASAAEAARRDPDRPVPGRELSRLGAPLLVLLVAAGGVGASAVQAFGLAWIRAARPVIARTAPDELAWLDLGRSERDGETLRFPVLDDEERPTGRVFQATSYPVWLLSPKPASPGFRFLETSFLTPFVAETSRDGTASRRWRSLHADPWSGGLRVVDRSEEERRAWRLQRPDGRPLSRDSVILFIRSGDAAGEPFALDPADSTLWHVVGTPPSLVAAPLPEGERALGGTSAGNDEVLVSANSSWSWNDGGWERHPAPFRASRRQDSLDCTILDPDPFGTQIEVTTPEGLRVEHRFALRSDGERLGAGIAVLGLLLRPFPLAVLGALTDYAATAEARPDEWLWLFDPLLGLGHPGLLWGSLAANLLLAFLAFRRLRRCGASSARAPGWALALLVTGGLGWLALLGLETRRAWNRPARTVPPPARIRAA